jgi:diphthamide synthase (EF-2-diphthine--ammonia ligase)
MLQKELLILSWSGGKDSVMSAYQLRCSQKYEIAALLTTVAEQGVGDLT